MAPRTALSVATVALACSAGGLAAAPAPASALNPVGTLCGVAGFLSGAAGKACKVIQGGAKLLGGGKKAANVIGGTSTVGRAAGIAAIGAWVLVGARVALDETAKIISHTTSPQLGSTWFSSTYWRMAGIAAILTLPFLFAAAVQALMRSDLAMLARAALVQLPLAVLGVSLAAPLTMLMLAATDQMSAILASASGDAGTRFLSHAGLVIGGLAVIAGAPFIAFVVGLFTVAGAVVLWLELLMREAAVYVVVLMLPLAFASFVWPARRVWAVRAVELLVALILSKFVIVAVLALGGAALGQGHFTGVTGMLAGTVLVTMGTFAPWALIRLLPLAELAGGAAGSLRGEAWKVRQAARTADEYAGAITPGQGRREESTDNEGSDSAAASAARAETERLAGLAELPAPTGDPGGGPSPDGGPSGGGPGGPGGGGPGPDGPGGGAASDPGGGDPGAGGPGGHGDDGGDARLPRGERLPGLGPAFQLANGEWPPVMLGPDPERRPVVPDAPRPAGAPPPPAAGSEPSPAGEDHDPRPPEQDPDEGRL